MLSEKLTNNTARSGLLTITDQSLSGPAASGFNGTGNITGLTSNDEVNQGAENVGQVVSDAKEGIAQSARVGNRVRTEDPRQFEFSEEQINECQKMTVSLRLKVSFDLYQNRGCWLIGGCKICIENQCKSTVKCWQNDWFLNFSQSCLQMRLDTMPINMDGVDIRSAENAG